MAKMTKEVMDVFNDLKSTKVLATAGSLSEINVVPKGSLRALDEETIAFADIFGGKTNKNLETNNKVAALALSSDFSAGYQVKGTFQGFLTSGELFDKFSENAKQRKMNVKAVGTIKVDEVYAVGAPLPGKKIA
jgi:predicted pyridoxine 5'-phosphate oxidase superfamily flavin-nucleotide-binding protein